MSKRVAVNRRGVIYTFYSFKGGAGRSMAVANVAALLARWRRRVLVLDWDLEAPGIDKYFAAYFPPGRGRREVPGLLDLITDVRDHRPPNWREHVLRATLPNGATVDIISAGRDDLRYVARLQELDWNELFDSPLKFGDVLEQMRTEWIAEYDIVLVDSRTGITDIGGICTINLPDYIVALFTANRQSLEGVADVIRRARQGYKALTVDRHRLVVLPVPAHDESDREYKLAEQWRARFAAELAELFDDWAPKGDRPEDLLNRLKLPYFSFWSFGERLPVLEEDVDNPTTLAGAYAFLAKLLMYRLDWKRAASGRALTRFDYQVERQRHEQFVGRTTLLARLDQLLVDGDVDRWVVVTGGAGMGKSALLAAWLTRREAAGASVPHHFIRRRQYDWDDPPRLVDSLIAQLEECFPGLGALDDGDDMHPAARLATALSRVSERALRPQHERLVLLIDGLDEYDPPPGSSTGDALDAFLPHALPAGVSLLCASGPRPSILSSLEARDGAVVVIDLDDPENESDNIATARAFWKAVAKPLGLTGRFITEAVERGRGNLQHAVQLRTHLGTLLPEQRRIDEIPHRPGALIERASGAEGGMLAPPQILLSSSTMKLRAVLVENEQPSLSRLRRLLSDFRSDVDVVGEAKDGPSAVDVINAATPDIVFLDIDLPGFDGFRVLKKLDRQPIVIYTTAYNQYALEAFGTHCVDYLLKPIEAEAIRKALVKLRAMGADHVPVDFKVAHAIARYLDTERSDTRLTRIACKDGDTTVLVKVDEVVYFRADNKYTAVHTANREFLIDTPLTELERKVGPSEFIRIHRSTVVNVSWIAEIRRSDDAGLTVLLNDMKGTELTVSRKYADNVRNI